MNNNLGKILIDLREKKGYTQKDLADKLNVSDKAVSRWETGSSIPYVETLVRISKLFKINLQDLIVAASSTDESDENLVQDIIKEFTKRDKKKNKIIQFILAVTLMIILILIITIIFTHTYNRFKVYKVGIESNEIVAKTGMYVETKIKDSLYLPNVEIKNYKIKLTDTVIVDLYYLEDGLEKILQTYTNPESINFVNYDSYIPINDLSKYKDVLYIRIKIIDNKNKEHIYNGKLEFNLDFTNNKIFYADDIIEANNVSIKDYSKISIIDLLLSKGFKVLDDDTLIKTLENGKSYYIIKSNIFKINYNYDKLNYKYTYNLNSDTLEVIIFNKENIEIENYRYDIKNNKIMECITGSCKSYDKAVKFLNENILYIFN